MLVPKTFTCNADSLSSYLSNDALYYNLIAWDVQLLGLVSHILYNCLSPDLCVLVVILLILQGLGHYLLDDLLNF